MPVGMPSSLHEALASGKYSDLTLRCEGRDFKVHKVMVCSQSDVLAAAINGSFREAATNEISIDFSADVVSHLVDYFNTQDYTVSSNCTEGILAREELEGGDKEPETLQDSNGPSIDAGGWDNDGWPPVSHDSAASTVPKVSKRRREDRSEEMMQHVQINAIAEYYNVEGLKELSREKLQLILTESPKLERFSDIVSQAWATTGDQKLLDELAKFTAENIEELLQVGFEIPDVLNQYGRSLVVFMDAKRQEERGVLEAALAASQKEIDGLERRLSRAELSLQQRKKRYEQLEETVQVIAKQGAGTCRNRTCPVEFHCTIEKASDDQNRPYFLRCGGCRCKQ